MKAINLDELEIKLLQYGIVKGLFTKEDLGKDNLVRVKIEGYYHHKTCIVDFNILNMDYQDNDKIFDKNGWLTFESSTWEDLYYKIEEFLR